MLIEFTTRSNFSGSLLEFIRVYIGEVNKNRSRLGNGAKSFPLQMQLLFVKTNFSGSLLEFIRVYIGEVNKNRSRLGNGAKSFPLQMQLLFVKTNREPHLDSFSSPGTSLPEA